MIVDFNEALLPEHAKKPYLISGFPQMFLFVKENENGKVEVCGVESLMSSIRHFDEDKTFFETLGESFNTSHLEDKLRTSKEKGATHLVTGVFNTLTKVWKQSGSFEIAIKTDGLEFLRDVLNEVMPKQANDMFKDETILKANLSFVSEYSRFSPDHPELDKMNPLDIYELMKELYPLNKIGARFDDETIPCANDFVKKAFQLFEIEEDAGLYFSFLLCLRAFDLGDIVFFNRETNEFDFFDGRRGTIDIQRVFDPLDSLGAQVFPSLVYSKRFLAING